MEFTCFGIWTQCIEYYEKFWMDEFMKGFKVDLFFIKIQVD